jgi:hypothetical protein
MTFLAPNKYGDLLEYRVVRQTEHYVIGTNTFTGQPIRRHKSVALVTNEAGDRLVTWDQRYPNA